MFFGRDYSSLRGGRVLKQQRFWATVIPILVALSAWVILGTHYDRLEHAQVPNFPAKYGLDIKGGVRVTLQADLSKVPQGQYDPEAVVRILEQRINGSGVAESTVQQKGQDQFVIELPDVQEKDTIVANLGKMAQMTMYYFPQVQSKQFTNRPIKMEMETDPVTHDETTSFYDQRTQQAFRDGAHIRQDYVNVLSLGTEQRAGATAFTVAPPLSDLPQGNPYYLTADQQQKVVGFEKELSEWQQFLAGCPVVMAGTDILPKSQAQIDPNNGAEPMVTQEFSTEGSQKMAAFTIAHTNEIMGIVLDDKILSAPTIDSPITEGHGEISGGFATLKEAQQLANMLNAGSLPVPLEQVQIESLEATLGAGAVHKSEVAGLIGLSLVLLFMLLYYRLPGLVADIALVIYTIFTMAIYRGALEWLFPGFIVTLTLPGIAGFILSIGMAVDANILIFERLKEELRNGKSLKNAIDAGFRRAFTAIRDSNICTIITSVVLWSLGTPSVKGFAITLLIGVLISLFSAITVTRTLLYALVTTGIGQNQALFGLNVRSAALSHTDRASGAEKGGWNIIGRRKIFYCFSLLIIVPGLIFWLGLHGLKKSIEFQGGTMVEVSYPSPISQATVESALKASGFKDTIVQLANGGKNVIVSTSEISDIQNPVENPVYQHIMTVMNQVGPAHEESFDKVAGVISKELTSKAIQAVLLASSLIVLYLAFSFSIGGFLAGLRFGLSAVIALLHDVLVLIGLFAIFGYFLGWKIDSLFVTALLTVIGFSVHDTVVIFDRVRENLTRNRGEDFETLVNQSIQQSLARSINTSLTVLMTLASLILFGGASTLLLNIALFIGILSGTYSSIFNASAILVDWENWLAARKANKAIAPRAAIAVTSSSGGSSVPTRTTVPRIPDSSTDGSGDSSLNRAKRKKPARRF